jgi:segregation and condensation protein B
MSEDLSKITHVLEAALLTGGEPVSVAQLSKLFDPPLDAETVRKLLDELRHRMERLAVELAQVASGWRFQARRDPVVPGSSVAGVPPRYSRAVMETIAIVAYQQLRKVTRGDIEAIRVSVSTNIVKTLRIGNGSRLSGIAKRPAIPPSMPPPGSFSTIWACVRWPSFRLSRTLILPTSELLMPPQRPPRSNLRSRAHSSTHRQPNPMMQRVASDGWDDRNQTSLDAPLSPSSRSRNARLCWRSAVMDALRGLEELIIAGRITINRQPAEVGQKSASRIRCASTASSCGCASRRVRVLVYHKPAGEIVSRSDPEGRPTVFDRPPSSVTPSGSPWGGSTSTPRAC